jgi:CDP-4-dehydro-6-deoxyglucose reductase, E1
MNNECKNFEENFSKKQGRKYSVFVSTGSCANLLIFQVLLNTGKLKKGDKCFVSGLTWPTNVMPLIQLGLVPILLDVEKDTFNVSSRILKENYSSDIKAFFLTNALGFCSDLDEIKSFCDEKKILLLEDNCEALGSEYKNKKLGNFGIASTFSFFVGHHLSTIEGGMICTDSLELYENLKLARAHGWTRNNSQSFRESMKEKNNVDSFYDIYSFYDLSYNFRPTEINGFIGNQQMNYWDEIVRIREANFNEFYESTVNNSDIIKLNLKGMTLISNFGFPLLFKNNFSFQHYKKLFEDNGIEIRPIIGGNISSQPFYKKHVGINDYFQNVDYIHQNGFYFGNNPEMTDDEKDRIKKLLLK